MMNPQTLFLYITTKLKFKTSLNKNLTNHFLILYGTALKTLTFSLPI